MVLLEHQFCVVLIVTTLAGKTLTTYEGIYGIQLKHDIVIITTKRIG